MEELQNFKVVKDRDLDGIKTKAMQFEIEAVVLALLHFLDKQQAMKHLRSDDVLMQLLNEELVLNVKSLDKDNKHIDVIWVVLTLVVLMIDAWVFDDPANQRFDH